MNELAFCILGLSLATVILSVILFKQVETLKELVKENEAKKIESKPLRKHISVGQSDFDNAFGGRKAYAMFKNTNGLYEPVTPSKGIKIEKKEE